MAKTRERKLEVAKKIYDIVVGQYGLAPEDLIYDALTFTLATGDAEWIDSGKETVEGIRLIKRELPGVSTILGVSNVSFGLTPEARGVLNSVFLHHCVQAGLDAAIVNPAHIRPYAEISAAEREMADDLVFNKRADALQRFIEYYDAGREGRSNRRHDARAEDPLDDSAPEERGHRGAARRRRRACEPGARSQRNPVAGDEGSR
jgi:5-methyltetrahydrofolate--homocysteine methyltransferase